jgi:hypothetical protein
MRPVRIAAPRLAALAALAGLLAGCQAPAFPERAPTAGVAAPSCPDWASARLVHPLDPLLGNPNPARELPMGCANDTNLTRMVADPADLAGRGRTGPAHAQGAVGAVQRYDKNEVTPLPAPTTTFGGR